MRAAVRPLHQVVRRHGKGFSRVLMLARILRTTVGAAGLIFLKASAQPGFAFIIEGEPTALPTFLWRFLAGMAGIVAFFYLRTTINRAYIRQGEREAALSSKWTL